MSPSRSFFISLIFSVLLNIVLLSYFFYEWLEKESLQTTYSFMPVRKWEIVDKRSSLLDEIWHYRKDSWNQLQHALLKEESVQYGYHKRDLALSILVQEYQFDLDRALSFKPIEYHPWEFTNDRGESYLLILFPGLRGSDYEQILEFVSNERWPFTPEGLFRRLKGTDPTLKETDSGVPAGDPAESRPSGAPKSLGISDENAFSESEKSTNASSISTGENSPAGTAKTDSLKRAFYLTNPFHMFYTLYTRSKYLFSEEELLEMLLDGEWEFLQKTVKEQQEHQEISYARQRFVLREYVQRGSRVAAIKLVEIDSKFILHQFSDEQLVQLLRTLPEGKGFAIEFAKKILNSPRSHAVFQEAQGFISEESVALTPSLFFSPVSPLSEEFSYYIVQSGDSWWKIAQYFHTSVSVLKKVNGLESDWIIPGMKIKIPKVKGHSLLKNQGGIE